MNDKNNDLKQRIAAAKAKQGLDKPENEHGKAEASGLGPAMRVGVEMLSAICVGAFIGYWIDRWLGSAPFGLIIFFFIGFAAGFYNLYKMQTKNYMKTGFPQLTDDEKIAKKPVKNKTSENED